MNGITAPVWLIWVPTCCPPNRSLTYISSLMHTRSYLSLSTPPCTMSSLSLTQYAHCCSRFIIEPIFLHHFPLPFVSFSHHPLAFDLVTYVESHACTAVYHTLSHLPCFIHQTQCHLTRSSFNLPKPIYFITLWTHSPDHHLNNSSSWHEKTGKLIRKQPASYSEYPSDLRVKY